jgi:hypothetical protein
MAADQRIALMNEAPLSFWVENDLSHFSHRRNSSNAAETSLATLLRRVRFRLERIRQERRKDLG